MSFVVCPCCYLTADNVAPHGGAPCPTAIALREAEIAERLNRAKLYETQREATSVNMKR